ncbi:G5 and 3D domain-containing protein [Bacillus solimangrovi]|uniref:G5 domain-containing protein n=1 Tax=Bacillus solimangrovi TaxID=1305675 RepID=A0A1E5LEW4_9BACI|nr:G5 and 3D domain-containing protein [Bacillus solimangrovi]OEH92621.1 hypothetical protein BFG57_14730 [Bacillus solimangrovi]
MLNNRFGLTNASLFKWSVTLIAAVLCISLIVFEGTKATVKINIDGKQETIRTHAKTVEQLLTTQDIELKQDDLIQPSMNTAISNGMQVTWEPAKTVTLVVNGEEQTVSTTVETIRELLHEQGVKIMERDEVKPVKTAKIEDGMNVVVTEAFELPIVIGGEEKSVWTTSTTVADLLKQQGVSLDDDDRVEPDLQAPITKETKIEVVRVEKVTDVVEVALDYAVVTRNDSSLSSGEERVISKGQEGKVKKTFEVVIENGKEVSRELINKETVRESKDRIVAIGTKSTNQPIISRGGTAVKEFYVKASAYTAYCKGCSGKTRTGIDLRANPNVKVIAVDPNVIPLGTKVWVDGYGYAIAGDTGSAIKGNRIDLFMPSSAAATAFGVKNVKIKILE